ncbi:uncharacterized protein BDR25DRAFT_339557 [Lindgomyces ingoldianus]|uniref:Uncharacterized protein n=1 Tax=Lindgomyces ingoldianus TaxID=673940 RepID=A0ACB6RBG7_9PLEO|nr:uncharacterized protein BDR25DRAFT_339557 [Lindgomyces ingoldianus]KAF2476589.1 hypothetical protein BDR25DRAFT_339557 [Lindgomyces ingoldianus]
MATNAPYYQLRGQFTTDANAQFGTDDDDYGLSSSLTPHNASLYSDAQNTENQSATLEENHNLVELLEAATTAAEQAAEAMNVERGDMDAATQRRGKRKRDTRPPAEEVGSVAAAHTQEDGPSRNKRARVHVPTDPQLRSEQDNMASSDEALLSDARAAGVHSAAALFRRTSNQTPKKYTRPPMSKLFMSLQLSPESFLHLQARAKAYMLDPACPERQNCVGNRGKGDIDMVKLRLFSCVRDFLKDGVGEQFFGENVEKPAETDAIEAARALGQERLPSEGKLVWPRDGNKIISLVTPLLRRMVTNERQRMYAIETRKGGVKKKEGSVDSTPSQTYKSDFNVEGISNHGDHIIRGTCDTGSPNDLDMDLQSTSTFQLPIIQQPSMESQEHIGEVDYSKGAHQRPAPSSARNLEQFQTILDPTLNHSIAQTQAQVRHSHPLSPTTSLPNHHSSNPDQPNHQSLSMSPILVGAIQPKGVPSSSSDDAAIEFEGIQKRPLPTENEWHLFSVNTYLTTKSGVKLEPQRKYTGNMRAYSYNQLSSHVETLVRRAVAIHPRLSPTIGIGMGSEELRNLAVAASNIQNSEGGSEGAKAIVENRFDSVAEPLKTPTATDKKPLDASLRANNKHIVPLYYPTSSSVNSPEVLNNTADKNIASSLAQTINYPLAQSPPLRSSSSDPQASDSSTRALPPSRGHSPLPPPKSHLKSPSAELPRESPLPNYKVQVLTAQGLTTVENADGWEYAKQDIGISAWAEGVVRVVVAIEDNEGQ